MGQYYKPLLIHKDGEELSAYSHEFDNGLKLMEHSWIGNNFVNAVLYEIKDNPTRVAWMGDYSDDAVQDGCNFGDGFITNTDHFLSKYESVWNEGIQNISPKAPQFRLDLEHSDGCYLVNITKRCYIDMEKYIKKNSTFGRFDPDDEWCINPLPLLTCVGNGLGGGDYHGEVGMEDVGSWAFDEIYITYLRPGNMEEVMYLFQEK